MSAGASRLSATEPESGSRYRLRDLFTPLDTLLASGGDSRLALDVVVKIELLLDRGAVAAVPVKSAFEV